MPNFDCGAYFLSTLIPVKTAAIPDPQSGAATSPVHLLRAALAGLATARQTPFCEGESPFARNTRNHFVRLVVVEDLAYVGRRRINPLITVLTELFLPPKYHINPIDPQPQDHLSCPFLFFSADFDAASGDDSERDAYLKELWRTAEPELRDIFRYCERFDEVSDADSFARYVARCQLVTTMPFHDYFSDGVPIKSKPDSFEAEVGRLPEISIWKYLGVFLGAGAGVFALLQLIWPTTSCLMLLLHLAVALIAGFGADYVMGMQAGRKSFPAAPDSTLPSVLKALYLRNEFTRFIIDNQNLAAADDAESARKLQDKFAQFVVAHRPEDVAQPTQAAGVVGTGA